MAAGRLSIGVRARPWTGSRPGDSRGGPGRLRHRDRERGRPAPGVRDRGRARFRGARRAARALRALPHRTRARLAVGPAGQRPLPIGVPEEAATAHRGLAGPARGEGRGTRPRGETGAVRRPAAVPAPPGGPRPRRTPRRGPPPAHRRRTPSSPWHDGGPTPAVETQREALTVWQPFGDDLLATGCARPRTGEVLAHAPDPDWLAHGRGPARPLPAARRGAHPSAPSTATPRRTWASCAVPWRGRRRTAAGRAPARPAAARGAVHGAPTRPARLAPATGPSPAARPPQAALASRHALAQLMLRRLADLPAARRASRTCTRSSPSDRGRETGTAGLPAGAARTAR
ncbi:hypothetical protein SGRIM128S_00419 [Streptomyces griseomycini]